MSNSTPDIAEALTSILSRARNRFSKATLERIEEAFRTATEPSLFSKFLLPYQAPIFYFPGLSTAPWHNPDDFEAARKLERGFPVIKAELNNLLKRKSGFQPHFDNFLVKNGQWNAFYLRIDSRRFKQNRALCPETTDIIESISRLGEVALISALTPGAHIAPHCGPWNVRITVHLGLIVPEGCEFRVADETRSWEEGKCLAFDDGFEHEAFNRGKDTRFCLMIDCWHPDLTPIEIELLEKVSHFACEAFQVKPRIDRTTNALEGEKWWI